MSSNDRYLEGLREAAFIARSLANPAEAAEAIEHAAAEIEHSRLEIDSNGGEDPESLQSDAFHVVVDVLIPRVTYENIRRVLQRVNASSQVSEGACSNGLLTVSSLLSMLAEDVGMVDTRPGSWEASNMAQVLSSHGYAFHK